MRLFREIGLASSIFLVIGNIVGIGIFTTSGLIAREIGSSFWLIGVWILGGLLALMGAICYSLLGIRHPRAGGEYAFLYPSYGPLVAFFSGWASLLIGFSAPIAAAALGLAYYLDPFLPGQVSGGGWGLKSVAAVVLLAVAVFISLGLKFGARLHSAITFLNLGLIMVFSLLVLYRSTGSGYLSSALLSDGAATNFSALGAAVVLVMFAYSGWNAAAYIAEEVQAPERNLPRALIGGTLVVMAAYLLTNLAYFSAAPVSALSGQIAVAEITASGRLGSWGPTLINLLISLSILSSITAMSIAGPRVYFAMARDGLFPKWLAQVHQTKKAPLKSIWFQSGVALVLILVGTFYQILLYSGFILLLFATLTASTLLGIAKEIQGQRAFWLFYRLVPAIFIAINSAVLASTVITHPGETLAGLLTVAAGFPVYIYYRGRRS